MASACVNNIGLLQENFFDCPSSYPSYAWFSPRASFSCDAVNGESKNEQDIASSSSSLSKDPENPPAKLDFGASGKDIAEFEFILEDPVTMLPADELFSDGKLVPLQLATAPRPAVVSTTSDEIRCLNLAESCRISEVRVSDPYLFSPKALRCSSRWKELLGLKKLQNPKQDLQRTTSLPSKNMNPSSIKNFLHRNHKSSSSDSSLSLPLLTDSDSEPVSISSHASLPSSSSTAPDQEDLSRLSLDSDKANMNPISIQGQAPPKVRLVKSVGWSPVRRVPDSTAVPATSTRGISIDSPRMNSSGKVVFQNLERSSSSPTSFNGGPRVKYKGMERSYSANVRVTPVLNVPVCSLCGSSKTGSVFGFGQLFSSTHKREGAIRKKPN